MLARSAFLLGDTVTEADVFLLPTAVLFGAIHQSFFKCGRTTISASYPHVARWLADMHRLSGIRATFDLDDAKRPYYHQLFPLNPSRIIAATPEAPLCDMLKNTAESQFFAARAMK